MLPSTCTCMPGKKGILSSPYPSPTLLPATLPDALDMGLLESNGDMGAVGVEGLKLRSWPLSLKGCSEDGVLSPL